jgi:hypothetical protein
MVCSRATRRTSRSASARRANRATSGARGCGTGSEAAEHCRERFDLTQAQVIEEQLLHGRAVRLLGRAQELGARLREMRVDRARIGWAVPALDEAAALE